MTRCFSRTMGTLTCVTGSLLRTDSRNLLRLPRLLVHKNKGKEYLKITATRRYTAGQSGSQQYEGGTRTRKWWPISGEWKIIGTIAVAVASWYINAKQDRIENRKRHQMDLVTRQLKELYGPLYGNRIVAETSYRAVVKQYGGLRKYLNEAERSRDAEMIRRWRSYVWNVLYPLDKEATNLICTKAHLIADREFPEEFERFLSHTAKMQFVMEQWKNAKGSLELPTEFTDEDFIEETNSSGIGGSELIIDHLRQRCRELRQRQRAYVEDITPSELAFGMLTKLKN